jgi:hypothetical protein
VADFLALGSLITLARIWDHGAMFFIDKIFAKTKFLTAERALHEGDGTSVAINASRV